MNRGSYEQIVTGRHDSFCHADMARNEAALGRAIGGSRVAIVGAAGSIGTAVVRTLLRFRPKALSLIDLSENNLVELVRDLRSSDGLELPEDFSTLSIGLGSIEFDRYFRDSPPFDYLLNLSAVKHVRSEKDIYCLMRMIDTNVVFVNDFLQETPYRFRKVFSVSSDKAANPANIMGASKMVMELVLLTHSEEQPFSTARFANVAFSDGSLPYGFLQRISKRQPLSAPNDVKRYFISHQEAGELCVLSCFLGENRDVFFPKLARDEGDKTFSGIAIDLLQELGYEPVEFATEEEAKAKARELVPQRKWPCFFFATDTTGEKPFEEFYTEGETLDCSSFQSVCIVKREQPAPATAEAVRAFITFARAAKYDLNVTKADYVREVSKIVPGFEHVEKNKNLDQKM